ncbi:MAG: adenosine deaminase [Pseudomonadota bacterium]
MENSDLLRRLPKAELHLHIEGSLEPAHLMQLAQKNKVAIPFKTVEEVQAAYQFTRLQDFLDIYYQGMSVLLEEEDFYALTMAYLRRVAQDGAVHAEIFYDPQGHTDRGIPFAAATDGILRGLKDGEAELGITSRLILCFLRHLSEEAGFATYREAEPYFADGRLLGVGLDSSEMGHPPEKFERLFAAARADGLKVVAHAGEEGPPEYVRSALDILRIDRMDHGNRSLEDPELIARLAKSGMTLTVCPLSNLKLCVVPDLEAHPLKRMLDLGLQATVNSDDPSYFGGYLLDNYVAVAEALNLTELDLVKLVCHSIEGSFLDQADKARHLAKIDSLVAAETQSA